MDEPIRQALQAGEAAGARYALVPPRQAVMGPAGEQLASRVGSSIEFMEHREYRPGDDIRRIDWSAYARTDRLIVRQYRDEVSPHVDLLIDGSRSMALAGSPKAEAAMGVAAALATASSNSGLTCAVWVAGVTLQPIARGREHPGGWPVPAFDGREPLGAVLAASPVPLRRQGVRALVSDLLFAGSPLATLRRLSEGAAQLVVVQVLAEGDLQPPRHGNVRLVDAETGMQRELFIDEPARQRYRQRLEAHEAEWALACRQVGAVMVRLVAERVVAGWPLTELVREQVLRVV